MFFTIAAYLLWGAFPIYFPLLEPASPLEILVHRIIWTAVVMSIVLGVGKGFGELRRASLRTWFLVFCSSVVIAANWGIYVLAVNSGHVAEAALGYFMNPLVNVLLGMVILHEVLRPAQRIAVLIAAIAVLYLTIIGGHPPIIGLSLAISFGLYGLFKKQVKLSATASLTAETLVLLPFAAAWWAWAAHNGSSTFSTEGTGHTLLLISAGLVTAVPLLLFGLGAKHVSLSTIGMLQYMTPTMQMLWAVFAVHEHLTTQRWIGFCIIWVSVAIYIADIIRNGTVGTRGTKGTRRKRSNPA